MASSAKPLTGAVLVVDDDALIRAHLKDLLEGAGHRALLSRSVESLGPLLEEKPSIAFVDLTLPGETGDQLCRRLRERTDTWQLPIVLMTAGEQVAAIRKSLTAGADDFLSKPLEGRQVLDKVRSALEGEQLSLPRPPVNRTVLLATRDQFFRVTVGRLLEHSGCEVIYSHGLEELSRHALGRSPPAAAIVDLDLSASIAELEALRQLQRHDFQPVPVVAVASSTTARARRPPWASAAPAVWAALSPYDLEEEREEVVRHVNRLLSPGPKSVLRRKVRVPFYAQVRFRTAGQDGWSVGFSFDLSEGGLFVRTLNPVLTRQPVDLEFQVFEGKPPVQARALVIWSNAAGPRHMMAVPFGMGLSFTDLPGETTEALRAYVTERQRPQDH